MRRLLPLLLVLATACSTNTPADTSTPNKPTGMSSPQATAFLQICVKEEQLQGPWNNNLDLQWLDEEGDAFEEDPVTIVEAGGVPNLVQDADGRLILAFQWFSCDSEKTFDQVAVIFSDDEGKTWTEPEPITIADFPDLQRPFDPTLAVLDDGRIRLYYTSSPEGTATFADETNIYSAISEDGIHYTYEEGIRFDVADMPGYDSAVGYWDGLWHMITPNNMPENTAGAHYGTSEDGLTFTMQDDLTFTSEQKLNWTGNFVAREDGLYFYGTPGMGQASSNWVAHLGKNGWEDAVLIGTHGGDPAVACIAKDRCLMVSVVMGQVQ